MIVFILCVEKAEWKGSTLILKRNMLTLKLFSMQYCVEKCAILLKSKNDMITMINPNGLLE